MSIVTIRTCQEVMASLRPIASTAPLLEGLRERTSLDTLMSVLVDAAETDMMSPPLPRAIFATFYEDPPQVPRIPSELRPLAHEHLWLASAAEDGDSRDVCASRALCCLVFLHNWPDAIDTLRLGCAVGYSVRADPGLIVAVLQFWGAYYYQTLPEDSRVEGVANEFVRALALTLAISLDSTLQAVRGQPVSGSRDRMLRALVSELPPSGVWDIVLRWVAPHL
jgi:hypothetical protein